MVLGPTPLPDEWPLDWAPGEFVFPEVWPIAPRRKSVPPEQEGLNLIMDFLLDEDWYE